MSNTITAYFKGRIGVAEAVYQNDYGIVMAFDGIDLPAHFDCFFGRLNQEEAVPGVGADNRVAIPNSVLANPGNVAIHIPIHTGTSDSEVEYVVYFKIIGRARPIDDGTPTQMTAIEQALALLQNPITNIEQIVNEALAFTGETFEEMQEDLDEWKTDTEEGLATWKSGVDGDIDVLEARMDTFTNLAEGSTTGDAELIDGRVGDDAVTYNNIGTAIRTQFSDVKSALNDISDEITEEFGAIFFGDFENGGLYSSSGLPYTSPNIRTGFVPVESGANIIVIRQTAVANFNIHEYDSSKTWIKKTSYSSTNESIRLQLGNTTKYIRVQIECNPSDVTKSAGFNMFYAESVLSEKEEALLAVAHNGIVNSWYVSPTIEAYLFRDGLFAFYGTGKCPAYANNNLPAWVNREYLSQIKKIFFDDRITYQRLGFLFTRYVGENFVPDRNRLEERIDIPASITGLYGGAFNAFDVKHINLYKCTSNTAFTIVPASNRYWHCIVSIPKRICNATFITNVVNRLESQYSSNPHKNTSVTIYITDSQELHDAIMACIKSQTEVTMRCNTTCILCTNLGSDGFPDYWNERMKTCITEVVDYIGRTLTARRHENSDHEYSFPITGLTALGNYSQYGYPVPFGLHAQTRLWIDNEYIPSSGPHVISRQYTPYVDSDELYNFVGQPISTSLENLASGLSCSGFVNFIFWRYFNENFGLSSSYGIYTLTGKMGQPLALTEIAEADLQPFDIICVAVADDESDFTGGHTLIYLGSYTDANSNTFKKVLQTNMGTGIVFGCLDENWSQGAYPDVPVKYFRLNDSNAGFHYGMIAREN